VGDGDMMLGIGDGTAIGGGLASKKEEGPSTPASEGAADVGMDMGANGATGCGMSLV